MGATTFFSDLLPSFLTRVREIIRKILCLKLLLSQTSGWRQWGLLYHTSDVSETLASAMSSLGIESKEETQRICAHRVPGHCLDHFNSLTLQSLLVLKNNVQNFEI